MRVALFPLNTVLFPGGHLPLRIFEARYIDMVSHCLKTDSPFGVILIRKGGEVGPATTHDVGTLARITDWYQGGDGLLGLKAVGESRFRLLTIDCQSDGLNTGEIEILPDEPRLALPENFRGMAEMLARVLDDLGLLDDSRERRLDDAGWVASRFVEILPIDLEEKQHCLERADPMQRLEVVRALLTATREADAAD